LDRRGRAAHMVLVRVYPSEQFRHMTLSGGTAPPVLKKEFRPWNIAIWAPLA
jgi:hypothetical protein